MTCSRSEALSWVLTEHVTGSLSPLGTIVLVHSFWGAGGFIYRSQLMCHPGRQGPKGPSHTGLQEVLVWAITPLPGMDHSGSLEPEVGITVASANLRLRTWFRDTFKSTQNSKLSPSRKK